MIKLAKQANLVWVSPFFLPDNGMVISEQDIINNLKSLVIAFLRSVFSPLLIPLFLPISAVLSWHALTLAQQIIQHLQVSISFQVLQEQKQPLMWLKNLDRVD